MSDNEEEPKVESKNEDLKKDADADVDENEDESFESGSDTGGESDVEEDEEEDDEFDEDDIDAIFDDDAAAGSKKKTVNKKPEVKDLANSIFGSLSAENDDDEEEFADDEEDDEDEEKYGFNYLQKFDNETRKQITDEYHRESLQHSYDEIDAMCRIVRTKDGIIDALHRTPPFLTKYEKARILGERAKQLGAGSKPFIKVDDDIIDEYTIAVLEMKQGKLPFIIKRPLPNGGSEYWRLADLEVL